VRESRRILVLCLLAALAAVAGLSYAVKAQTGEIPGAKRRVKVLAKPQYPDLARRLNLSGVVKVEVTIEPDGKVKRTRILGGHPVLAAEAERAAMASEFEPGPKETTEVIDFKFGPGE